VQRRRASPGRPSTAAPYRHAPASTLRRRCASPACSPVALIFTSVDRYRWPAANRTSAAKNSPAGRWDSRIWSWVSGVQRRWDRWAVATPAASISAWAKSSSGESDDHASGARVPPLPPTLGRCRGRLFRETGTVAVRSRNGSRLGEMPSAPPLVARVRRMPVFSLSSSSVVGRAVTPWNRVNPGRQADVSVH
jgi:hypothetical protein